MVAALFSLTGNSCANTDDASDAETAKLVASQDFDAVVKRLLPAAKRGDPDRQFAVGYFMRAAIEKPDRAATLGFNTNDAIVWLYMAATSNTVPQAAGMISDGFKNGWFGLPKNTDAANCWRQISTSRKFENKCTDLRTSTASGLAK